MFHSLDDTPAKLFVENVGFPVQREQGGKGEPLDIWNQTAQLFSKLRWQHGHRSLYEIDACRSLSGLTIEGGICFDYISNVFWQNVPK